MQVITYCCVCGCILSGGHMCTGCAYKNKPEYGDWGDRDEDRYALVDYEKTRELQTAAGKELK